MVNRIGVLRVLADVLEEKQKTEKRNAFDMAVFFIPVNDLPGEMTKVTLKAGVSPEVCGTKLCVAGFATIESGWSVVFTRVMEKNWKGDEYSLVTTKWISPTGKKQDDQPNWEKIGAEYLGLTEETAHILFFSTNDQGEQAIKILERLARGDEISEGEWFGYASNHGVDMETFWGEGEWLNGEWSGYSDYYEARCDCGCQDFA
jgi:hypothetical protein